MQIWKITQEGMGGILYLESLNDVEGILGAVEDNEVGTKLIAEVIEMEDGKFRTLPEFECFE